MIDLSERQIVDCADDYDYVPCSSGGYSHVGVISVMDMGGLALEADYPYSSSTVGYV